MEIPQEAINEGANYAAIFVFDEGSAEEIREARDFFNELVAEWFSKLLRTAVMDGFHRPTQGEFRKEFLRKCLVKLGASKRSRR